MFQEFLSQLSMLLPYLQICPSEMSSSHSNILDKLVFKIIMLKLEMQKTKSEKILMP